MGKYYSLFYTKNYVKNWSLILRREQKVKDVSSCFQLWISRIYVAETDRIVENEYELALAYICFSPYVTTTTPTMLRSRYRTTIGSRGRYREISRSRRDDPLAPLASWVYILSSYEASTPDTLPLEQAFLPIYFTRLIYDSADFYTMKPIFFIIIDAENRGRRERKRWQGRNGTRVSDHYSSRVCCFKKRV